MRLLVIPLLLACAAAKKKRRKKHRFARFARKISRGAKTPPRPSPAPRSSTVQYWLDKEKELNTSAPAAAAPREVLAPTPFLAPTPPARDTKAAASDEEPTALLRQTKSVKWLHFPKAGMSFKNSLVRVACPSIPDEAEFGWNSGYTFKNGAKGERNKCPESGTVLQCTRRVAPFISHPPLKARNALHTVLCMFREPSQRLMSAFHAGRHAVGMEHGMQQALKGLNASAYARTPGIAGCSAKMLLGYKCAAHKVVNTEQAVEKVKWLGFVGITGHWTESIVLLHAQLGIGPPKPVELQDTHPGKEHPKQGRLYDTAPLEGFVDEADAAVYGEATRVFGERRKAYAAEIAEVQPMVHPAPAPRLGTNGKPRRKGKLGVFCAGGEPYDGKGKEARREEAKEDVLADALRELPPKE